jgi:serine protease AprX
MKDQADLGAAAAIADQDARGWYVYNRLRQEAARTQADLRSQLDADGVPYKAYWAANMIVAQGDRSVVDDVAARSDVQVIEPNAVVDGLDGEDGPETTDEGNEALATEVGVTNVQGPSLWSLGFTGQGIVVADQDTGMRWTHAALRTHYRGWISGTTADHNYNWWDAIHARITSADGGTPSPTTNSCGINLQAPCDDHGHGTHTIGTSVGSDTGAGVGTGTNQIGVAPGAKWIGCRNMDAGNGRASTYTECFQFFLAPTDLQGQNADPTRRPHVMNNSWGCPLAGELCARNVMKTIVETSEAAGIFVEASAGNDGSACNTVKDPPAIYASAFSTGAISGTTNALASFSSRGAVSVDGSNRMKPDLSAPGSSVRSSLRNSDTSYGSMSGTSMAGPHVVGVVALLWSARPNLVRDIPRTEWLLTRSANPNVTVGSNAAGCGGIATRPNNHFGWGRIDARAAYDLEPSLEQTISLPAVADHTYGDADFALGASASSGLPVEYSATGSCTVGSGGSVHITGVGPCTVTATQPGLDVYGIEATAPKPWYPAPAVSRTFGVTWPYSGFFAPIANDTANVAQPGSAVPVKFSLGADRGLAVLAAGYPTSTQVDCAAGTATTTLDPTVTAGQSGLAYDPLANQYVYVWKTEKAWAGSCRQLTVRLVDGSVHTAAFRFKG